MTVATTIRINRDEQTAFATVQRDGHVFLAGAVDMEPRASRLHTHWRLSVTGDHIPYYCEGFVEDHVVEGEGFDGFTMAVATLIDELNKAQGL